MLELNAARVTGRLKGKDSKQRWEEFLELSSHQAFWDDLAVPYPSLRRRIDAIVSHRCDASLTFARHWTFGSAAPFDAVWRRPRRTPGAHFRRRR